MLVAAERGLAGVRENVDGGALTRAMPPAAGSQNAGVVAGAGGPDDGGLVGAEIDELAGDAGGGRCPGVGVVVGELDRAGRSDWSTGCVTDSDVVLRQPAAEGLAVGPEVEAGYPGELVGIQSTKRAWPGLPV